MKKPLSVIVLFLGLASALFAANHQTIAVHSAKMNREIPVSVITPDSYAKSDTSRYPVIYALHGAGGDHLRYSGEDRPLRMLSDRHQVVVVVPDGGTTSWWLDSPVDPSYQYETFVAKELVAHMDQAFRTIAEKGKRAIAGGSMGGHGACYIGFRNKDVFGAVGNIFGGVDLRPFPDNWDIKLRIGTKQEHPENWERFSVVNNLEGLKDGELSIITMVGSDDFFLEVNRDLNQRLQKMGVQHYHIESKGKHEVPYEYEAFTVVFRFIDNYFRSGKGSL